jgi:hypothetical protein
MLKGTKWILLKNPANLDESKNEPERLNEEYLKLKILALHGRCRRVRMRRTASVPGYALG